MSGSYLLRMEQITKRFGGIQALHSIDLEVAEGEAHAIVGENGAGKSTLMKILARELKQDSGNIFLEGQSINHLNPWEVQARGLQVVHQDLNVIPSLSVGQNILMGSPPIGKFGLLNWNKRYADAEEALRLVSGSLNLGDIVNTLGAAERQLVILARALVNKPRVLILDEPTARLGLEESEMLFSVIDVLKRNATTIIYISHRLEEIYRVCDRVTILRDGSRVLTSETRALSQEEMVTSMIGRKLTEFIPKHKVNLGDKVIEVRNLKFGNKVKDISFTVRSGEVLGIVGAVGAGQNEVLGSIFGACVLDDGLIELDGQNSNIRKPKDAIKKGICLIPEDRSTQGLVSSFSISDNLTLVDIKQICRWGLISNKKESQTATRLIEKLQIHPPNPSANVKSLSGGNQQKVVLGKWLLNRQRVYLLNEVTAGVDVGAKSEIYRLIGELAESGSAIILATSDINEALGLCDRIVVIHKGKLVAELDPEKTSIEKVLTCVMGGQ